MKKKTVITLIIIVLLTTAGFVGFRFLSNRTSQALDVNSLQTEAAEIGNLTATIGETGTVRARQTSILTWKTSGTVEQIRVSALDFVSKGEILAELDLASLSQSVIQAKSDLISAQEQLDDLYRNFDKDKAEAQLAVITAQQELDDLKKDRDWLNYPRCDQDTIENYQSDYQDAVERVANLEGRLAENPDSGGIREQLVNARKVRDTAFANYNYCSSPREENELNKADTEIALAQAKLELANREVETFANGKPSENDVTSLETRIEAAQATLAMTQIKAPFAGKITSLDIQPGDQVSTGTTAFRIDDLSQMLVDLEISEIDVNSIEVGQEVIYSFDAIPGSEYHGRVSEIETVGNSAQGVVEFKVTTTLTDADEKIKAGMTAIAEIVVEEYENTLLVPNQAVRVVDGNRIIYILAPDGSVAEKTIELGAQSVVYSQVIGGELKAGDKIILNPTELTTFQAGQGGPMGGMFSRGN